MIVFREGMNQTGGLIGEMPVNPPIPPIPPIPASGSDVRIQACLPVLVLCRNRCLTKFLKRLLVIEGHRPISQASVKRTHVIRTT